MIKKVKAGYKVTSEKGKNLGGPYKTREEAAKRLATGRVFQAQQVSASRFNSNQSFSTGEFPQIRQISTRSLPKKLFVNA